MSRESTYSHTQCIAALVQLVLAVPPPPPPTPEDDGNPETMLGVLWACGVAGGGVPRHGHLEAAPCRKQAMCRMRHCASLSANIHIKCHKIVGQEILT